MCTEFGCECSATERSATECSATECSATEQGNFTLSVREILVLHMKISVYVQSAKGILGTVPYYTVQYNTVLYGTVEYSTLQYSTVPYSTIQ